MAKYRRDYRRAAKSISFWTKQSQKVAIPALREWALEELKTPPSRLMAQSLLNETESKTSDLRHLRVHERKKSNFHLEWHAISPKKEIALYLSRIRPDPETAYLHGEKDVS